MSLAEALVSEFDHEMKVTRSMLERVPFENPAWKPHAKSRSMSVLASHIANVPGYGVMIATRSEFDTAAGGSPSRGEYTSREELLTAFDQNVKAGRDAMSSMRDEDFRANWTFRRGDQVILNGPRALALRTLVMSHLIHHRGQLSVYLRLNDVPLPSVYGPTADT